MTTPTVADLEQALEGIAPLGAAESWDKVGLHVGDHAAPIDGPVLLTIDLTEPVLHEAIELGAKAVVVYHPPIFSAVNRLTTESHGQRILMGAVKHNIALYSPHTALDAAAGGVTDWLCEGIAGVSEPEHPYKQASLRIKGDLRALSPEDVKRTSQECKIVTFVPADALERVRGALATAGAGRIGAYEVCSFSAEGQGTFLAGEGTHPVLGEPGRLESVEERRLEMVCSRRALPLAIETLRQFHPYEEPAFDIYELIPEPRRHTGPGRRLVLDQPATLAEIGRRLKTHLGISRIRYGLPNNLPEGADRDPPITTVAVVPGAGASLADLAAAQGCQAFITGEMKHHDVLACLHKGMGVLVAGHTNTERGYLPRLRERLARRLPTLNIAISTTDRDPLEVLKDA